MSFFLPALGVALIVCGMLEDVTCITSDGLKFLMLSFRQFTKTILVYTIFTQSRPGIPASSYYDFSVRKGTF